MAQPTLTVSESEGLANYAIPLTVVAVLGNSADTLTIEIGPLPQGAALTAGTGNTARIWTLESADLTDLRYVPPRDAVGAVAFLVAAKETDSAGQVSVVTAAIMIRVRIASQDELRAMAKDSFTPATPRQRVTTGICLLVATLVIVRMWFHYMNAAQAVALQDYSVAWAQPAGTILACDDTNFWYDSTEGKLHHQGGVDAARKQHLLSLLTIASAGTTTVGSIPARENAEKQPTPSFGPDEPPGSAGSSPGSSAKPAADDARLHTYRAALDALAFKAASNANHYFFTLLILAGISGVVGVLARATINFVRVACTSNQLDISRWWPWYVIRPQLGFILGVLVVLLIKSDLITPEGTSKTDNATWWIAVAFLVGFGAEDFSERLRSLSQTLFGKS